MMVAVVAPPSQSGCAYSRPNWSVRPASRITSAQMAAARDLASSRNDLGGWWI